VGIGKDYSCWGGEVWGRGDSTEIKNLERTNLFRVRRAFFGQGGVVETRGENG